MKGLLSIFLIVGVLGAIALGIFVLGNKEFDSTRFGASVVPLELSESTLTPEPEPQPQPQPQPLVSPSSPITVKIQPLSVQPGQSITITIAADKDLSSPLILVNVSLASPSSSKAIRASIVNIDGDGNRFGSIDIPADAEKGTWRIQIIEIDDRAGVVNLYTYGQGISATFTVL